MSYEKLLKRNIDEFISQCIIYPTRESFIKFLDRKDYDNETNRCLIIELLKNEFVLKNKECLNTIAYFVVRNNDAETLSLLINNYNIDPSYHDDFLLTLSIELGFTEVVKVLLSDSRINPKRWGNYYIKVAINLDCTELLKILLNNKNIEVTEENKTNILKKYSDCNEILELISLE